MLRYAGWLDGETLRVLQDNAGDFQSQPVCAARGALKAKILLGHSLAISDVQLLDSSVVTSALADPAFLSIIAAEPEALHLRARPAGRRLSEGFAPHEARARSGLVRTLEPKWVASSYEDVPRAKRFFAFLESKSPGQLVSPGEVLREARTLKLLPPPSPDGQASQDLVQLRGVVNGLAHFCALEGASSSPPEGAGYVTYDQVLSSLRNVSSEDGPVLEEALGFINQCFGTDARRTRRSDLQDELNARHVDAPKKARIWNTAVLAWNCATGASLGLAGGVYGQLPGAVKVPTYRGMITDVLVNDLAGHADGSPRSLPAAVAATTLRFDFDQLSWTMIAEILSDKHVGIARKGYQLALRTGSLSDDVEPLKRLLNELRPRLAARIAELPELNGVWLVTALLVALAGKHANQDMAADAGLAAAGGQMLYSALRRLALETVGLQIVGTLELVESGPVGRGQGAG